MQSTWIRRLSMQGIPSGLNPRSNRQTIQYGFNSIFLMLDYHNLISFFLFLLKALLWDTDPSLKCGYSQWLKLNFLSAVALCVPFYKNWEYSVPIAVSEGKYSFPSLSIQLTTATKSATKLGISHLTKAEFPTITYTSWAPEM